MKTNSPKLQISSIDEVLSKLIDHNLVSNKKTSAGLDSFRLLTEEPVDDQIYFSILDIVRVKYSLTPKKLLQKVSQLILLGFSVHYNILKVCQSRTPGKVFFSRWRPRWPPKPLNDHNSVTINSNLMILVSIPRFWGGQRRH